jgi:CheY-like chemotaxis protein
MRSLKPILLVEDDDVDVMTIKRAFKDLSVENQLVNTNNGEQALEYLKTNGNKEPCVILLDLNMPKMNGIEFLIIVKADMTLKKVPVVVLTTSNQQQDITECFKLGVAGYMVKSVDYDKFVETIRAVNLYWTISELPSNGE